MDPKPEEPEDPFDDQHTDALIVAYGGSGEFLDAVYRMGTRAGIKFSQPPPGRDDGDR